MRKVLFLVVSLALGFAAGRANAMSLCAVQHPDTALPNHHSEPNPPVFPGPHSTGSGSSRSGLPDATQVMFTVDLDALDVDVSPAGAAKAGSPGVIVLPVTGGDFASDPIRGTLEHESSGIDFDFGAVTISVENLEFRFTDLKVNADLSAGPAQLHTGVFNLKACASGECTGATDPEHQFGLFLRAQAADFFENNVLGDTHFDDEEQIALATIGSSVGVVEPNLVILLGASLGALAAFRGRRALTPSTGRASPVRSILGA